jgi:hypothetical protein
MSKRKRKYRFLRGTDHPLYGRFEAGAVYALDWPDIDNLIAFGAIVEHTDVGKEVMAEDGEVLWQEREDLSESV